MKARTLMAGGILSVAAVIGGNEAVVQQERAAAVAEFNQTPAAEHAKRKTGEEIKSLRTANSETFKADNALVIRPDGVLVKVARYQSRVYAGKRYWKDADADTLRPLDLTVREISALARLNPLRTHDKYVDAGPYTARWMNETPGNFRMETGGLALEYRAIYDPKGATVTTEATPDGMKETVVLVDADAEHTLRWIVETDGSLVARADNGFDVRSGDGTVPLRIDRPKAWDKTGKPVMAVATVQGDTLTFKVTVLPGQEYPVTVDPTTTVTAMSGIGEVHNYQTDTYANVRNAVTGGASATNSLRVGQLKSGSDYDVFRSFLAFPSIPGMASCSACTLYFHGTGGAPADKHFTLHTYGARLWRSVLTTADYSKFSNWAASGAYDSSKVLTNPWHTSTYVGNWETMPFTAAGLDSMKAASSDTLWVVWLSNDDVRATAPAGSEYMAFNYTGANAPYLSFTYTPPSINPPTDFFMAPITGARDSMLLSLTKNYSDNIDSLVLYQWPDSVRVATLTKTAVTARIGGLNPYIRYRWYVRADSVGVYGYSNPDSCWTTQTFKTENFTLSNTGYVQNNATAVYDSARGEIKADSLTTGNNYIGQQKSGANYLNFRNYLNVALPAMIKAHAESLFLKGDTDASTTDFSIAARSGTWGTATPLKSKYFTFDGWQSQMTAYTGTALASAFSTAGFTTGATMNKIPFTQAGRDTTIKRYGAGDSLKVLLLSSKDVSATAPTGDEYVIIDASNSYLRLTYAPPDSAPTALSITSISADSLLASWTDRSYSERGFIVVDAVSGAKVAGTDTTAQDVTSLRIGGLSANTSYAWKVKAVGGGADGLTSAAADSCYTRANTPGKPTTSNPADSLLKFIIKKNNYFQRELAVDPTKIDAALDSFPVLVKLTSSNFTFAATANDGRDIHFTLADGTELSFDRERHDKTNSLAEYWVKIPTLPDAAFSFYIIYGDSSRDDSANRTAVWDTNFKMVQHMADSTTSRTADATSNGNFGTKKAANEPVEAAGKIGKAQTFDGGDDYVQILDANSLDMATNDMTISMWIKRASISSVLERLFIKRGSVTDTWYDLFINSIDNKAGGSLCLNYPTGYTVFYSTNGITDTSWHHIVVTFDRDGNGVVYLDTVTGIPVNISAAIGDISTTANVNLGAYGTGTSAPTTQWFNGTMDEVRISNTARSAAWIKAEYYTGVDSLLTYGAEAYSDLTGNPSYTEYAVQDSISGKYVDFISGAVDTFRTAEEWRTYANWGGVNGDTVAVGVGKRYTIRVKARSGQ